MLCALSCFLGLTDSGHTKTYRAHVKEKFSEAWFRDSVMRCYGYVDKELTQKERKCLEFLFAPEEPRKRTVILTGARGVGKTTVLAKLMLAWAEDSLYQRKFSYVFYLCCREVRQVTATSLAALICRDWSDSLAPITEITAEPEKLLFILDGFEELMCDLDEPESDLCSDWMAQRPVQVVLSSLLRKKMLPESSLLVATVPAYTRFIEHRLGHPEIETLLGLTEDEMLLSFSCMFRKRWRGVEAFHFIRSNKQLLSMCQIPILCWATGTCLRQELERGKDLALTCRRTTSLYSSFVLNLFTPKGARCPDEESRVRLRGLCSLAAEGMWSDTFVFGEEDLRRNGLADSDIPALLDTKALRKGGGPGGASYTFLHLCIQEVCAALFYFVKGHADHPSPAVGRAEAVLAAHLKRTKAQWIFLPCFLFGLLNEKEQQKLGAFLGARLCQEEVRQAVEQHLRGVGEHECPRGQLDVLVLYYCLFEMEDDAFVRWAVDLFPEVSLLISDPMDLIVLAYCLARCSALRTLGFCIQNVFVATPM